MGTFERIRQISPYAFGVFAVLLIAFFTIGDPTVTDGLLSGNSPQNAEIGSVNGDPLLFAEFDERVSLAIENQKSQMQDPNQEINYAMIRNQVWEQMVGELIMKQEAEKAGIRVTPEMIVDEMLNNPPDEFKRSFRDSAGNFMRQMYLDVVTNPDRLSDYINPDISPEEKQDIINNFRSDLLAMEDYLKQNMIRDNLMAVIGTSGLIMSPEYAKKSYLKENSSADVWYISFPAKDFKVDDSEITENEIEEYYKKNREFYKQKPARKLKYISMPLEPSKEDSAAAMRAMNEINKAIQQNKDVAARDSIFDVKMAEYGGESHEYDMIQNVDPNVYGYMSLIDEGDVVGPIRKPDGNYFYRLDGKREGENHSIKASHILIKENNNKGKTMKKTSLINHLLIIFSIALFTGCSEDDDNILTPSADNVSNITFILSEGSFESNDATLWLVNDGILYESSLNPTGDTGNSMDIYNNKLYLVN